MKKTAWLVVSCLMVVILVLASCGPAVTEEEEVVATPEEEEVVPAEEEVVTEEEVMGEEVDEEEKAPPPPPTPSDTIPPSAITGLVAADAYDGKVNLWWDKCTARDFDHYDIYVSQAEIVNASGMTPFHRIADIAANNYQVTGLEGETKYYFAVTAADRKGNENTRVATVSVTSTPMPRGTVDPDIYVDVYETDLVWAGTTLLPDNHQFGRPRIIEVNMLGEIVWEYLVPEDLGVAGDVELLANNNILFTSRRKGVYEIDRSGNIVWSYLTDKVSHDADRLPNGNTLINWGHPDEVNDAQVKEANPQGEIVWTWYAKDHFYKSPYKDIYDTGWIHTNAVTRLPNGNTVISLRNFNFVVEVDAQGAVVKTFGEGILHGPHDPEVLPNGNILVASLPDRVVEIDARTGKIVWQFKTLEQGILEVRDVNRLPNGNTLLVGAIELVEVTAEGEIVWHLGLKGVTEIETAKRFYKAERIGTK